MDGVAWSHDLSAEDNCTIYIVHGSVNCPSLILYIYVYIKLITSTLICVDKSLYLTLALKLDVCRVISRAHRILQTAVT